MDKEYTTIVLDYPFHKSSIVNDFLRETGLDKSFRVVLVSVPSYHGEMVVIKKDGPGSSFFNSMKKGGPEIEETRMLTRVGLEPLDKETDFYWQLKGSKSMQQAVDDYIASRPYNRGVS